MTDIEQLLHRAVDGPVPVDVSADLARGRVAARRRRTRLAAVGTGLVLAAAAVGVGVAAGGGDDGAQVASDPASATTTPTPSPSPSPTPTAPEPTAAARTLAADPVDPATLVDTDFFSLPPAPAGWYLVGARPPYAMYARQGTDADLDGTFVGRLMVMLSTDVEGERPDPGWQPLVLGSSTFYRVPEITRTELLFERSGDGDWLSVQYPHDAGFELADMAAFLDAVEVLPGAGAAS